MDKKNQNKVPPKGTGGDGGGRKRKSPRFPSPPSPLLAPSPPKRELRVRTKKVDYTEEPEKRSPSPPPRRTRKKNSASKSPPIVTALLEPCPPIPKSYNFLNKLPVVESYPTGVRSDEELARLGQKNYKLSEVKIPDERRFTMAITPDTMVQEYILPSASALTQKVTAVDKETNQVPPSPPPFEISAEECKAILHGMVSYVDMVPPDKSFALFQPEKAGERGEGGWIHLAKLSNELPQPEGSRVSVPQSPGFALKMAKVMAAGGTTVDVYEWSHGTIGYAFGYWLARLYNRKGVDDEDLPLELLGAKQNFIHLNDLDYCTEDSIQLDTSREGE